MALIFGARKVGLRGQIWQKEEKKVYTLALLLFAASACVLLSPLLLTALLIKNRSTEQKFFNHSYYFWKCQLSLMQKGYIILASDRSSSDHFSFTLKNKIPTLPITLHFRYNGKLKFYC